MMPQPQPILDAIDVLLTREPWRRADVNVWLAQEHVEKGLAFDPTNVELLRRAGRVHIALEDWLDAERLFTRVLATGNGDWRTHNDLGVALLRQGQNAKALEQFLEASDRCDEDGYDVCFATNAAVALYAGGSMAGAQAARERALAGADLESSDHLFRLSWMEAHFRSHVKAVQMLWRYTERAVRRTPIETPLLPDVEEIRERLSDYHVFDEQIASMSFVASLRSMLAPDRSSEYAVAVREVFAELGWLAAEEAVAG